MEKPITREDWLHQAIDVYISKLFEFKGLTLPKQVRVSVGLPYGRGSKKSLAQHWSPESSDDKVSSIFISPTIVDTNVVLGCLIHELVHAVVGNKAGHGKKFKRAALAVGLEGKMTSTVPSEALKTDLEKLVTKIGKYPHAKLNLGDRPDKKQTTRMLKIECTSCGFICRASHSSIISSGIPHCGCNKKAMLVHLPEDEG